MVLGVMGASPISQRRASGLVGVAPHDGPGRCPPCHANREGDAWRSSRAAAGSDAHTRHARTQGACAETREALQLAS